MKIDKQVVFEEYMQWIEELTDKCDWKTSISYKDMVSKVVDIIEEMYNV